MMKFGVFSVLGFLSLSSIQAFKIHQDDWNSYVAKKGSETSYGDVYTQPGSGSSPVGYSSSSYTAGRSPHSYDTGITSGSGTSGYDSYGSYPYEASSYRYGDYGDYGDDYLGSTGSDYYGDY